MDVRELLIRHEGMRLKPYVDTVGKTTIGVGRNLTDIGISQSEALGLLDNDIAKAQDECDKYPWFSGLSDARKAAMLSLVFNLGPTRLAGFVKFLKAMAASDWAAAAEELEASKWYAQVKSRGPEIVNLILANEWPV